MTKHQDTGPRTSPDAAAGGERPRPANLIGAVDNVLRLLRLFETRQVLRVNEVGREMGLSRSTVHRMLATLLQHDFVIQDPISRGYCPGPALVDIGLAVVQQMDIRVSAKPFLEALKDETGETVHLAELRDAEVVFLDGLESDRLVRAGNRIGQSLPAYATAAGKALLAELPDADVRALLPDRLPAVTDRSIRTVDRLLDELDQVRDRGYSTNQGESEEELSAVAAPVRDRRGRTRAALVTTAPRSRVDRAWIERIGAATIRVGTEFGATLG
ncbi:IclR family transcriptional regulator [Actinomadura opuntiae]|uniref:IclR family transcriptional regulator n=1 Tax=Actinomadura sp. OS1-43 TaxID=604315 RepID=UPI00255B387C|nr:IclR family transcriptional regulator [Actinomadura sp. OS1-43]MDL4821801.1 IclR family transcriptional regulator [Actinomadura sp. OS1-43]